MIDVVEYGAGNTGSILRCLDRLEMNYQRVHGLHLPSGDNPILFPGVGAFGAAMANLTQSALAERLRCLLKTGTPYLGICIGLQVLFEQSEEAPDIAGLCVLSGQVVRFQNGKVPQIGWNWIKPTQPGWEAGYVYFVNSYYPKPDDPDSCLYKADYHGTFSAAVQTGNITAFQFHPEKSGAFGQTLLRRWLTRHG